MDSPTRLRPRIPCVRPTRGGIRPEPRTRPRREAQPERSPSPPTSNASHACPTASGPTAHLAERRFPAPRSDLLRLSGSPALRLSGSPAAPSHRPPPTERGTMFKSNQYTRILGFTAAAGALALSATACAPTPSSGSGGSGGGSNKMTVSYSQVVADQLPIWIALDSGLFKKQGLDVTLRSLSGSDGFPALISGQTQMASIGASEMVSGAAPGAKVSYLATLTPVFPYQLFAKVKSASDLKGKRIGITTTSGSLYVATLTALKQLGLTPHDVHLVPLGSVTNTNNALIAGTIDAAVSHPPASTQIEAAGYHSILDLAKQKIPTSNVGLAATNDYVSSHTGQIKKFMAAVKQAIKREKSDEKYSVSELSKHLKVKDSKALHETYAYYAREVLPDQPTPTVAQLQTSKDTLKKTPGVSGLNLSNIVDDRFFPAGGQ
jgi:NitT/TauT family transport system substrate-binding protein